MNDIEILKEFLSAASETEKQQLLEFIKNIKK